MDQYSKFVDQYSIFNALMVKSDCNRLGGSSIAVGFSQLESGGYESDLPALATSFLKPSELN